MSYNLDLKPLSDLHLKQNTSFILSCRLRRGKNHTANGLVSPDVIATSMRGRSANIQMRSLSNDTANDKSERITSSYSNMSTYQNQYGLTQTDSLSTKMETVNYTEGNPTRQ